MAKLLAYDVTIQMNLFGKTFAKYYLILGVSRKEI